MNQLQSKQPKFSVALKSDAYQKLINDTLGDKEVARRFVAEISSVVAQNSSLSLCDAGSILSGGLLAQTMNLPLSPSLGFCYLVPYKGKAQLQIGYKGLIQLAQRSSQFRRIGVREVHEGEYVGQDKFGDDIFKFDHKFDNNKTIGFYAYFELLNGFEKTMYMTENQAMEHGKKYSKAYNQLWTSNFNFMAQKTVLKLLLNRYAPLSTELKTAIMADQAVIGSDGSYNYVDNPSFEENKKTTVKNTIDEIDLVPDDNGEIELDKYITPEEKL